MSRWEFKVGIGEEIDRGLGRRNGRELDKL